MSARASVDALLALETQSHWDEYTAALALLQSLGPSFQPSSSSAADAIDNDPYSTLLRLEPVASTSRLATVTPSTIPIAAEEQDNAIDWLVSILPLPQLLPQVLELVRSPATDDVMAGSLLELIGYEVMEDVAQVVRRRGEIIRLDGLQARHPAATLRTAPTGADMNGLGGHSRTPQAQITFQTAAELLALKRAKKASRHRKGHAHDEAEEEMSLDELERIREASLAAGPGELFSLDPRRIAEVGRYPHVYLSSEARKTGNLTLGGEKTSMPSGTLRESRGEYEEIIIPAPAAVPFRGDEELMPIKSMDPWGQSTFHAYQTLNRLQSIVFPVAYNTNENMLVCAPTGAGKTDVALLAILRCLSSLCTTPLTHHGKPSLPPASTYKIIYVAPLKALAAEITLKFSKRLGWAGVKVRELTGDMKLTKQEVEETGVIVTTPEKWDVVTRKGAGAGDGEVAEKVKLLIIDEVHLLHEDRGAVIESIVARTLRLVESSQTLIRIVGLSATLPNYVDVADFLRVNRYQGLFYFDASFRPVPLEQHFIGVKGKAGSMISRNALDSACFDKVAELLRAGHQVMVFVHARKDTVKTAQTLREKAAMEGILDLLDPNENDQYSSFKRDMGTSRNREMKELAGIGFGIHHAGMLRSDRNISERMFEANVTKVLCCTATLAWGVNLPAYAVVIKGTQVYDSGKGAFVDLGILDVLQIFGRAGRPQYETQGVGYICTTADKLDHYVAAITQQHPIESKFIEGLVDSINAEISLGTVTNMDEGVRWLGYSYLFVRMRKNPLLYGMVATDVQDDPLLGSKRHSLITISAKRLAAIHMIKFDPDLGTLIPTELGRIASRYYIRNASIEIFNKMFRPQMSEADVLGLIASSVEFNQIQVRENEVMELGKLLESSAPCQVSGGSDSSAGKVNILLQAYISKAYVEDFALVSDMGYVAQNAGRIVRALLEIAMSKKWAPVTLSLMAMSKAIEKRMWPFNHPLGQFDLGADLMYNIERWADDLTVPEIAVMTDADFGVLVHQNERLGGFATRAARQMPTLAVSHSLQPLAHDLLRVTPELSKQFEWSDKHHGSAEAFWVWIEDEANLAILQMARILVRPGTKLVHHEFIVSIPTKIPAALYVRVVSDRWMGAEDVYPLTLDTLIMPSPPPPHLPLLDLPLLSATDAFSEPTLRELYAAETPTFDPVQTQAFHTLYHTSANTLLCAPSATARGTMLELAIWRAFGQDPSARVLFLTPRKALARHVSIRIRHTFSRLLSTPTLLLSRAHDLEQLPKKGSFIAIASPSPLVQRMIDDPDYFNELSLIIAHDLHALDPAYELLLARLKWKHPHVRIVGSSSSLLDATDLASFLDIPARTTLAFSPSTRSSALATSFQPSSTPHSIALLRSMIKPAYSAMRLATGSTLCFVPSRSQCRATAKDLVTQTAADLEESFVVGSRETIGLYADSISDPDLAEALSHGIAVFHEGLKPEEQRLALDLFGSGAVRILIASREACWTLPVRASLIIVMSAQYAIVQQDNERAIKGYPLPELLQMQSLAVAPSPEIAAECLILCQTVQADLYSRFLTQGLPLESELAFDPAGLLSSMVYADLVAGRLHTRQDVVDSLSWTLFSRRLESNPCYYTRAVQAVGPVVLDNGETDIDDQLSRLGDRLLATLEARCCVVFSGQEKVVLTSLGQLGLTLDDIARLQDANLDKLVELSADGQLPPQHRLGDEAASTTALDSFHLRLPRAVRDTIGVIAEGGDFGQFRRRILLAAFAAGRIPRGDGGLDVEQVELVRRILSVTGVLQE